MISSLGKGPMPETHPPLEMKVNSGTSSESREKVNDAELGT